MPSPVATRTVCPMTFPHCTHLASRVRSDRRCVGLCGPQSLLELVQKNVRITQIDVSSMSVHLPGAFPWIAVCVSEQPRGLVLADNV